MEIRKIRFRIGGRVVARFLQCNLVRVNSTEEEMLHCRQRDVQFKNERMYDL